MGIDLCLRAKRHTAKFLSLVFGVESGLARRNMYVACQDFTIGNLAPQWSHIEEGEPEFANILRISCKMVPGVVKYECHIVCSLYV